MNAAFNFKRFGLLCKREFTEGSRQLQIWFTCLVGVLTAWSTPGGPGAIFIQLIFYPVVIGASALLMQNISNRQKRMFYLTIPASPLEKLLSRYLYTSSIIFVIFPAAFILAKLAGMLVKHYFYGGMMYWPFSNLGWIGMHDVWMVFSLQAVFMLGSMVWLKSSVFKTILFHICFVGLITIVCSFILFSHVRRGDLYPSSLEPIGGLEDIISVIHILVILLFYVLCYFRFKELGVIHKIFPLSPSMRIAAGCYLLLFVAIFISVVVGVRLLPIDSGASFIYTI